MFVNMFRQDSELLNANGVDNEEIPLILDSIAFQFF